MQALCQLSYEGVFSGRAAGAGQQLSLISHDLILERISPKVIRTLSAA